MTKDEALTKALEALDQSATTYFDKRDAAITAIKAALVTKDVSLPEQQSAQYWAARAEHDAAAFMSKPEQEPVAEIVSDVTGCLSTKWADEWTPNYGDKLYASPPQREWVGLTDEEKESLGQHHMTTRQSTHNFIVAIEVALKVKNT